MLTHLRTFSLLQSSKQSPPQFRLPAWLPRGPRGQSHHTLCPPLAAFSADHAGAEPEEPSEAYICKTTAQFAKEISHFTEEAGKAGKPQTLTITHVVSPRKARLSFNVIMQCCFL